jgi:hypothetical protein
VTDPKAIRDKIKDVLEKCKPENCFGAVVKKWFRAEPLRARVPSFPYGWVEWNQGLAEPPISSKHEIRDAFFVFVVDRHVDAEKAEDSVLSFCKSVEDVLALDPTFGGSVGGSWVSLREKEKLFEGDHSVCGVRITVQSRRRE